MGALLRLLASLAGPQLAKLAASLAAKLGIRGALPTTAPALMNWLRTAIVRNPTKALPAASTIRSFLLNAGLTIGATEIISALMSDDEPHDEIAPLRVESEEHRVMLADVRAQVISAMNVQEEMATGDGKVGTILGQPANAWLEGATRADAAYEDLRSELDLLAAKGINATMILALRRIMSTDTELLTYVLRRAAREQNRRRVVT